MLQTCMGRDASTTAATATATSASAASMVKAEYHVNSVGFDGGGVGVPSSAFAAAKKAEELREALADVLPEDIPGIPTHRPELSPTR